MIFYTDQPMLPKIPVSLGCHICTFLDLNDHIGVAKCSKYMKYIAQHPYSITHDDVEIKQPQALLYHPTEISIYNDMDISKFDGRSVTELTMHGDIKGLTILKNLMSIRTNQSFRDKLTSLTKLHTITYTSFEHVNDAIYQIDWLPSTVKDMFIENILDDNRDLSQFITDISNHLKLEWLSLTKCQIPGNISLLKIDTLSLYDTIGVPQINIPSLRILSIMSDNWLDLIRSINIDNITHLHLIIRNNTRGLIEELPRLMKIQGLDLSIDVYCVDGYLPSYALEKISMLSVSRDQFFSSHVLKQIPNLQQLSLGFHAINVKISCGCAKFHYWPKLNCIIINDELSRVYDMLYTIHQTGPFVSNGKAPYMVYIDDANLETVQKYIADNGMEKSFACRLSQF